MNSPSLDCRIADLCSPLSPTAACAVRRAPCAAPLTAPLRTLPLDDVARSPRPSRTSWLATLITLLGALHGKTPPAAPVASAPAAPVASAPAASHEGAATRPARGPDDRSPEPAVAACACAAGDAAASEPAWCERR